MQVYKVFLKIVRENIGLSIMYLCIFLFISLFMVGSTLNSNNTNTNFEKTSLDISIINNDIDSDITKGLYDTLAKNNNIKDI